MTVSSPILKKNLYILQESNIVRTGRLKYYNPLRMSDMLGLTLTTLNVVSDTLPSSGSNLDGSPVGINYAVYNIQILDSGSLVVTID